MHYILAYYLYKTIKNCLEETMIHRILDLYHGKDKKK